MKESEERLRILEMLEAGKVSAEEAAALLRALEGPGPAPAGGGGRYLRVHVSDTATGAGKVNVTIPVRLVEIGLRIAERFAPNDFKDIDLSEISELIAGGAWGRIVEVVDEEDGERVEIYVE